MMRCLYPLRRRVALIICPELAQSYSGMTKPMERAARDAWLDGVRAAARAYHGQEGLKAVARDTSFLNQGDQADGQVAYAPQDQGCGPKSWEALQTVEQAAAFLEGASAEELREMGERLLGDRPLSREEVFRQQLILRAQCSSERLTRRYFAAMGQVCPAASPHLAKCQQGTVS